MGVDSQQCSCGLAAEDRAGQAYNEGAFRHFLAIERARAESGHRSFLLMLVTLKKDPRASALIAPAIAAKVFAGLALCVREVDFIGWYRQERVAAAVLTQGLYTQPSDVPAQIAERVKGLLARRLPSSVANRLQVRVLQLRPRPEC